MAFAHFAEEMEKNLWRSFAPRQLSASLQRKWLSSENLIYMFGSNPMGQAPAKQKRLKNVDGVGWTK